MGNASCCGPRDKIEVCVSHVMCVVIGSAFSRYISDEGVCVCVFLSMLLTISAHQPLPPSI